jgi:hypothetical protein
VCERVDADPLERVLLVAKMFEQPQAFPQQHRHDVDLQFVDGPAPQQRLNQSGAPTTVNCLPPAAALALAIAL